MVFDAQLGFLLRGFVATTLNPSLALELGTSSEILLLEY
jgi:hypothetical protein